MEQNHKEKDAQELYRSQRLALCWLLGLIYSGFVGLQLGRIQAITDFNYGLHEIMYLPVNIAMYFVPVLFIIYTVLLIKYFLKRGKQKPTLKASIRALLVIVSIVMIASITTHQFQEVSTGGVFEIEKKLHEDRKYYIVIDNKKVEVTRNEFQLVEVNKDYLISFIWNKKAPNTGQLKTIEH